MRSVLPLSSSRSVTVPCCAGCGRCLRGRGMRRRSARAYDTATADEFFDAVALVCGRPGAALFGVVGVLPGRLGFVEVSTSVVLISFGVPVGLAVAAVVLFRSEIIGCR